MPENRTRDELVEFFGEETVRMAVAQEILAQRYITRNPIPVRKALEKFQALKTMDRQRELIESFDKEMARAFICSLLCGSASKAVLDLGKRAIGDKRAGRAVLGGKILQK